MLLRVPAAFCVRQSLENFSSLSPPSKLYVISEKQQKEKLFFDNIIIVSPW